MTNEVIDASIKIIEAQLENKLTHSTTQTILGEIKTIEKYVSSNQYGDMNGNFVIDRLYLDSEPSDCCEGCVKVPKLYTAYKNQEYLEKLSESDFSILEGEVNAYLKILKEVLS